MTILAEHSDPYVAWYGDETEREMMFDPMRDVPTTDEEVRLALVRSDELVTKCLWGLYQALRAQGKSLIDAYRETLETHVHAYEQAR